MVDMAFNNWSFFGMRIFCKIWYYCSIFIHTLYIFFTAGLLRKYNFVLSFPLLQWVYLLFCLLEYTQLVNCGSFWEIFHRLLNTPLNIFWPELYV